VIPESLVLGYLGYFDLITQPRRMADSDLGILERLKRRVRAKAALLSPDDYQKIEALVYERCLNPAPKKSEFDALTEWFALPLSHDYSARIIDKLLKHTGGETFLAAFVFNRENWRSHPLAKETTARGTQYQAIAIAVKNAGEFAPNLTEALSAHHPGPLSKA